MLSDKHKQDLKKSCLLDETIEKAGYQSTNFVAGGETHSGWSIEYRNPLTGKSFYNRYRFDKPENPKRKYHQPAGTKMIPYFTQLKSDEAYKADCEKLSVPVVIVEGEKKLDCLYQFLELENRNVVPIGLAGIWNWSNGNKELHDLIEKFVLKKREFIIVVDSDYRTNNKIQQGITKLIYKLLDKGSAVNLLVVPGDPDDHENKQGIDDYLLKFQENERSVELLLLLDSKVEKITKEKIKRKESEIKKKLKEDRYRKEKDSERNVKSEEEAILPVATPGQIVLNRFFNEGQGYMTHAGKLRKYNPEKGFYKEIDEHKLKQEIANFFDDDSNLFKHGKAASINDAIEYVKIKTFVDPSLINPPGLNVLNGYLRLTYKTDQPIFELVPHSQEKYFTYCAECKYDPSTDVEIFNKAVSEMLLEKNAQTLLRTIASQFDIQRVRQKIGRIKVLLLYGVGSNGKDTFREWTAQLISQGFTNIGLQAFKAADQGRTFGIFGLTQSKINWSSENKTISLDNCQSLKNASTGDPLDIEEKYKQGIACKPKTVFMFNINEAPHLEATQEAILSRYGIINFPNVFKQNPDPKRPNEKKADPRLKEDIEYIKEKILPAFLNRLVTEFQSIFSEGIDYSINEELLKNIQEDSNHFIDFINEKQLIECPTDEGTDATSIFKVYKVWCIENSYFEVPPNDVNDMRDIKIQKYHDPSNFDKLVRNPKEMGKRLRKDFPGLKEVRKARERILGLKFLDSEEIF